MAMPQLVLQIASRKPDRIYCDVCENNWSKKGRTKLSKVDKDMFKTAAATWQSYEHAVFSKVYERVDWTRTDLSLCKTCHGNYFHKFSKYINPSGSAS